MSCPKVTIGITTRNRAALLSKALDSALNQDYPNKEIVVYDIASTDETPALKARYPQLRWLRSEERLDMISPRNRLMRESHAKYFFTLDDDASFLRYNSLSTGISLM